MFERLYLISTLFYLEFLIICGKIDIYLLINVRIPFKKIKRKFIKKKHE